MPKRKASRKKQREQKEATAHRRRAAAEARREAHARLVVERQGDPRFVQQQRTATGRRVSWDPNTPAGAEIQKSLERQREAFVEKFGREPGPDDPIFFDPDKDEPTSYGPDAENNYWDALESAAEKAGLDVAYIQAGREVGYLVTSENQHLYSAMEVEAYEEAVRRHLGEDEEDFADEITEPDFADFLDDTLDALEGVVAATLLDGGDEAPALSLGEGILRTLDQAEDEAGGSVLSSMIGGLMGWLVGAREDGIDPAAAVNWVHSHLSEDAASAAHQISGLIGHPLGPDVTVNEIHDRLGPLLVPAMIWLAAGVAATAGLGDAHWLRQFDVKG